MKLKEHIYFTLDIRVIRVLLLFLEARVVIALVGYFGSTLKTTMMPGPCTTRCILVLCSFVDCSAACML